MATFTPKQFFQVQPTTSFVTQYTVPGSTSAIVKDLHICNTTGNPVTIDLSMVPSGGTAGVANALLSGFSVGGGAIVTLSFSQVMATSGFLSVKASTGSALTVTCSGVEVT